MNSNKGQRFLVVYSGVLTVAVAAALLSGFASPERHARFDVIDVERINIVEPDGTLRLAISDNKRLPGLVVHGHEYADEGRKANATAGMLFYDGDETESGGLIFGGRKAGDGSISRFGHLSFDRYDQDQILTMDAEDTGTATGQALAFLDQPSWSIEEYLQLLDRIKNLPPEQQQAQIEQFLQSHPLGARRAFFGRQADNSTALQLRDPSGNIRAQLVVGADGNPALQFLDAAGKVTHSYP